MPSQSHTRVTRDTRMRERAASALSTRSQGTGDGHTRQRGTTHLALRTHTHNTHTHAHDHTYTQTDSVCVYMCARPAHARTTAHAACTVHISHMEVPLHRSTFSRCDDTSPGCALTKRRSGPVPATRVRTRANHLERSSTAVCKNVPHVSRAQPLQHTPVISNASPGTLARTVCVSVVDMSRAKHVIALGQGGRTGELAATHFRTAQPRAPCGAHRTSA